MAYYESIYNDQELSHRAKAVYIYLKDHANKESTCWPRFKTIAAGVSLSHSTVKRALDDLVQAGVVVKVSRWRGNGSLSSPLLSSPLLSSNLYYVLSLPQRNWRNNAVLFHTESRASYFNKMTL